jgi:hypothetical protein
MNHHSDPLLIAGCSLRKRAACGPVTALELYEGGIIPQLRFRIGHLPVLRRRVRILSAKYGLISADHPAEPYDLILDPDGADRLRPAIEAALHQEFERDGTPDEVLVVAEPLYVSLVSGYLTNHPERPPLRTVTDPRDWRTPSTVLDMWGWP